MGEPMVSVLLSVNRDRGRLDATLRSVLSQSFDGFELIIVNDAGPSALGARLAAASAADVRIRLLENEVNQGLTRSLNRALARAGGRYVARIDEGDIWLPGKLEHQVRFLEDNPTHVLVGTRYRNYTDDDLAGRCGTTLPVEDQAIRRWLFAGLNPLIHPSIVFRRGPVSYSDAAATSQDFELFLRLSLVGRLHNLPNELVLCYRPRGAVSVASEHVQFFTHAEMHRQFLDVLRGRRDARAYVLDGTDFSNRGPLADVRFAYMQRCLRLLAPLPKRSLGRRLLRNLLIPDFPIYYAISRSAPYRLRKAFRSYKQHERPVRP
jgi:glycosyltransferase involved in cell wall biosynthesis